MLIRIAPFSLLLIILLCWQGLVYAATEVQEPVNIAVVGKTKNDSFYQQSHKGCQRFARDHPNVHCIYDGADDYQDVRTQVLIVKELIRKGIDGLLISTTDSQFLVDGALKLAAKHAIPVITFDSDLLSEHAAYRLAYVGTNNFDFGKALGEEAKRFKVEPQQYICLQSGHQTTPNLNQRIAGVRYALSGQSTKRLSGENGWIEHYRCPLFTFGRRADALDQLVTMMKYPDPPIFLAVAGFAQFNPDYITRMAQFKSLIADGKRVIISADTENSQLKALQRGLSVTNIGQKPFEMGRLGAELLHQFITQGREPAQSHYFLDFHYCNKGNSETCTTNH
ncbi:MULTISPECIES: substrate-binding domain-containing protein [Pseudoalteromonas]|uniref:substrate-binding domain-containing protein n=1 Tax=Pseudoalteromonas TaxID=53246 RepID=UPI001EF3E159|nr:MULTISPECIES: substrate-binding domain-containing protein [Pseudoalteromonas]MCG7562316.1 substrate-binding domain-containing protein [Pseudoalteromonas sp. McH1-42]MEC4087321.1 substrate-binding domain-containing protein [Pseudoalteromonas rubra]